MPMSWMTSPSVRVATAMETGAKAYEDRSRIFQNDEVSKWRRGMVTAVMISPAGRSVSMSGVAPGSLWKVSIGVVRK